MRQARRFRRTAIVGALIALLALAASPALGDATFPRFNVYTYDQALGHTGNVNFAVELLTSAPAAADIAITAPDGYQADLSKPLGNQLGRAEVDAVPIAGGAPAEFDGALVVWDPAAFAADPQAQACAPGPHTAAWRLVLNGSSSSFTIPIAVDPLPTGGSYKLVICLDAIRAAGFKPVYFWFQTRSVFRNPTTAGLNTWSALVTPFDVEGARDPTTTFELRGATPLPETLSIKASYYAKGKILTVRGTLMAAGAPRVKIRVHLYAGSVPDYEAMPETAVVLTNSAGAYVFQRRMKRPRFMFAGVNWYYSTSCHDPSTAPGGCATETTDGIATTIVRVTTKR